LIFTKLPQYYKITPIRDKIGPIDLAQSQLARLSYTYDVYIQPVNSRDLMFRILLILFILVPIIEIAVFIQVGEVLGLGVTLFIVVITAVLGVNLLKQQGFKAWRDIQLSMAQGNMPAVEMAAGAQLLFAGGLLLTPGFVTDIIGFSLMIPQVRLYLARQMLKRGMMAASSSSVHYSNQSDFQSGTSVNDKHPSNPGRTIEGDFEEKE
jgi:UPF0716 protein FxsA